MWIEFVPTSIAAIVLLPLFRVPEITAENTVIN